MGLFGFGKKKEEKKEEMKGFACSLEATVEADADVADLSRVKTGAGVQSVKILGSGCKACHILYDNTKTAISELGLPIEVEDINDLEEVMSYGIMQVPGLVINGEVVSVGKALKVAAIKEILEKVG